ncbi:MAG: hypothetical protein AB7L70_19140 [Pyrinomonadaceae bacterium]
MGSKTLDIDKVITRDQLGCRISDFWMQWTMFRSEWINTRREIREYIYATDTTKTTNSQLPWSNKTTIPKLTQIRDNLYANYLATMFPKRRWLNWEGADETDETREKVTNIKDYMTFVVQQPEFKEEIKKLILDYIDAGNAFGTVEWVDETTISEDGSVKIGYVGPRIVRISPIDIVMNPTGSSFRQVPKIVRALMSMGEAKEILERLTVDQADKEVAQGVFNYCRDLRQSMKAWGSAELVEKDRYFQVDGFTSFRDYLNQDLVELLFFYGDIYDIESDKFSKNQMVVVIDRHKVLYNKKHSYPLAEIPIYHAGWRVRQDNLWAMGPLDNLVGMQYRLDHIENMKSDLIDLTAFPPVVIKGIVSDFNWGPLEKIYVDADGSVELLTTDLQPLQSNVEMSAIESRMEEMAGSPKEAMGFRTPGEKTAYEVQRLENAASRIFQNKIAQFEEQILEPLLNACLVLAQNHLEDVTVRVIEDEFKSVGFRQITKDNISANGRIKPVAARHFAERAEMIQNLTNFYGSAVGQDPEVKLHLSSVKTARMLEDLLDLERYELFEPYVRIHEQAEAQQQMNAQSEEVMTQAATPSGLTPEDSSGL